MISTHILDTCKGTPANGVLVTLQKQTEGTWQELGTSLTNSDGRCTFDVQLVKGSYQLVFEVGPYLKKESTTTFYSKIPVVFVIEDTQRKYHVPLLLNPFGYSTYRGS